MQLHVQRAVRIKYKACLANELSRKLTTTIDLITFTFRTIFVDQISARN